MEVKMIKRLLAGLLAVTMSFSIVISDGISVSAEEMPDTQQTEEIRSVEGTTDEGTLDEGTLDGEIPNEGTPGEDNPKEEAPEILNGWVEKAEGWYYYKNGIMQTGWLQVGSTWYYMEEDGLMAEDTWIGEYYVDANGAWITHYRPAQWILTGGRWWYRDANGSYPANRWKLIEEKWYYFDAAGYMVTGWLRQGNAWYYLDGSGAMATGWLQLGGSWYYLDASGAMKTGWFFDGATWYYLNGSGVMATDWLQLGGSWYYLGTGGTMVVGQQVIGKQTYYFNDSGVMVTGWNKREDGWRYYTPSGAMAEGWVKVGTYWYCCQKDTGIMYESEWIDDKYYVQANGAMAVGWFKLDDQWYYSDASGLKQTNKWVDSYYVQNDGTMAVSKWIGEYYVGADGKWIPLSGNDKVYSIDLGNGKKTTVIGYFDTEMSKEVFKLLNNYRIQKGLNVLQPAGFELQAAVETRGAEIAYSFDHQRPNGDECFSVYSSAIAENIAAGPSTASAAITAWKNSSGHNKNMLLEDADSVGIAVFKLKSGNTYYNYFVQLFAS